MHAQKNEYLPLSKERTEYKNSYFFILLIEEWLLKAKDEKCLVILKYIANKNWVNDSRYTDMNNASKVLNMENHCFLCSFVIFKTNCPYLFFVSYHYQSMRLSEFFVSYSQKNWKSFFDLYRHKLFSYLLRSTWHAN